jgi:hypothetical protein
MSTATDGSGELVSGEGSAPPCPTFIPPSGSSHFSKRILKKMVPSVASDAVIVHVGPRLSHARRLA